MKTRKRNLVQFEQEIINIPEPPKTQRGRGIKEKMTKTVNEEYSNVKYSIVKTSLSTA